MTAVKRIMHSGYMNNVFGCRYEEIKKNPLKSTVRSAARRLRDIDFDYVIMTGVSGITFGAALCYCMDKCPIVIRKQDEKSHATYMIEGYPVNNPFRAIIVDDFVATGKTIENIKDRIGAHMDKMRGYGYLIHNPTIVGAYFYERSDYTDNIEEYVKIKKMSC